MINEKALVVRYGKDALVGIAHLPSNSGPLGVLVLVGGPQYRVGSHRQFVLLSRTLAGAGFPVFRFDHRGIGDSSGEPRNFQALDDDIKCAIDIFLETCPQIKQVHIWGLCDAASAASLYTEKDPRVAGLVMLNPWVRSESGITKSFLMDYYTKRLFDYRFWKNAFGGNKSLWFILKSAWKKLVSNTTPHGASEVTQESASGGEPSGESKPLSQPPYQERMLTALQRFQGRTLIILSGNDLTAAEFRQMSNSSRRWKKLAKSASISWFEMSDSNHTFSTRIWRDTVAERTVRWLRKG